MANLYFQKAYKPEGISTLAMSQYDGSPEPVIRELLQNSLDAAGEAGFATEEAPAEVSFRICDVPISSVPGLDSYREAFKSVIRGQEQQSRGPDAKVVIDRIRKVLSRDTVRCLFCQDNGIGLDEDRLRRILAEAASNKGEGGGSFGVGHMTAFSASNLRYVLYGGRYQTKEPTIGTLISGHAVLSSHEHQGEWRAADGYLLEAQSDLFTPSFCEEAPSILSDDLSRIDKSGAVVCIVGFNGFREDMAGTQPVVDAVCRVASTNFLSALWRGRMRIRIFDEISNNEETVDYRKLGDHLRKVADQKRVRGAGAGWIAGSQAFRAWKTLEYGRRLNTDALEAGHLRIWFRNLETDGRRSTRVNLFRNGMWITRDAPGLQRADFADVMPFNAVVSVVGGRLYELVRGAEGPEHRGIEPKRLVASDRIELKEQLRRVGQVLRSEAVELRNLQEFVPQGFAVFSGERLRDVDPLPRFRPLLSEGDEEAIVPKPGPRPGPGPKPSRPNPRTPQPGRAIRIRSSLVPVSMAGGPIDRLQVRWEIEDGTLSKNAWLGFRVRRGSGSDESCEQPIPPEWLTLKEVKSEKGPRIVYDRSKLEAIVPARLGRFEIFLKQPIDDLNGIQIDVVRRKIST